MIYRKCRKRIFSYTLKYYLSDNIGLSVFIPVLGFTILVLFPAAIYSCSPADHMQEATEEKTVLRLMSRSDPISQKMETIDILTFNDDKMQKLDAYQRAELSQCSVIRAASTAGQKIMVVLLNSQRDRYDWADINSYCSLEDICVNLEKEIPGREAMSGEHRGKAGNPANVQMERLASEIVLRSINCDFKGKSYAGHVLEDAKIYLTNVNAEAPLVNSGPYIPKRIVNAGRLDMDDVAGFEEPGMVFHEFEYALGETVRKPDIRLRCYPNETPEEVPGAPFTRLVVEGKVDGRTYYWPVNINRDGSGDGIERNKRYIFDIRITRLGHTSADIPIETDIAEIIMEIQAWEEKEEYGVRF